MSYLMGEWFWGWVLYLPVSWDHCPRSPRILPCHRTVGSRAPHSGSSSYCCRPVRRLECSSGSIGMTCSLGAYISSHIPHLIIITNSHSLTHAHTHTHTHAHTHTHTHVCTQTRAHTYTQATELRALGTDNSIKFHSGIVAGSRRIPDEVIQAMFRLL